MSGGAEILGVGMLCPEGAPSAVAMPAWWGEGPCFAHQLSAPPGAGVIPPGSMRRLGRTQRMALAAAHLAVADSPVALRAGEDAAVAVGTGLGELGETAAFLENMIALDEREPRPASFVNSVHNSLASQIAMGLGLKGENHLFTHGAISFELALAQALHLLDAGRAEQVLVCGADGLSPYTVAAGRDFGWWRSDGAAILPIEGAGSGTLPGEGAAALLLARPGCAPGATRIAGVLARPASPGAFDPANEVRFIESALESARLSPCDVGLVLCGANGDARSDGRYRLVRQALDSRLGRTLPWEGYKGLCGEFCTAPALGAAMAARQVRGGRAAGVLLYHLAASGQHSVMVVSR